jgi:hypothetical protein
MVQYLNWKTIANNLFDIRPVRILHKVQFNLGNTLNASDELLPVYSLHVSKLPLTTEMAFSRTERPCSVGM